MQSRIQGFGSSANPGDSRKSSASSSYAAPPVGGGSAGGSMSLKGFGSANKDGLWKSANGAAGNSGHQSSGGTLSTKGARQPCAHVLWQPCWQGESRRRSHAVWRGALATCSRLDEAVLKLWKMQQSCCWACCKPALPCSKLAKGWVAFEAGGFPGQLHWLWCTCSTPKNFSPFQALLLVT